ncbi:LOW QUALITY PROTEIN: protein RIC-3 [Brachionichthys hirsutus]|uniref:LOW QUALITY PROTEIN: protein RIC-3 n=1 Tax=Brachionichthys hirsutus TaxID=412623 RepID=UPI0036053CA4
MRDDICGNWLDCSSEINSAVVPRGKMAVTTCQKVTLISCSILCVSLFLPRMFSPRGKKETGQLEVGPGFYPPVLHQRSLPGDPERWALDPSYSITHGAEAMVKVKSIGRGRKYNLMTQVIPIYGFGILLYILFIIYKLTCKGKTSKSDIDRTVKTNMKRKITMDSELARLQERLLRTEMKMERIISGKSQSSGSGRRRKSRSTSKKEEKLLRQLRQITQLMQEGRLEAASPEMEAEEVPYGAEWEGYPEETYPMYEDAYRRPKCRTITPKVPPPQPTAEALAERMEQEEEEVMARKLSIVQEEDEEEDGQEEEDEDAYKGGETEAEEVTEEEEEEAEAEKRHLLQSLQPERKEERIGLEASKELRYNGGKKQITFSDRRDVFRYPKEDTFKEEEEEDESTELEEEEEADEYDPVMEAESLQFDCGSCINPEEEAEKDEERLFMSPLADDEGDILSDTSKEVQSSGLRMRNRRET